MAHTEPKGFDKRTGLPYSALRIKKLPKNIKTIDDLLAVDNINDILSDIIKEKSHIKDLVIIYTDSNDDSINWQVSSETLISKELWMLEVAKNHLLNDREED
jgi:hypothetical protein